MRVLSLGALLGVLVICGALGEPYLPTEVPFSAVERTHFDAIAVMHEREPASEKPLTVYVRIIGDAADCDAPLGAPGSSADACGADVRKAVAWLQANANIVVKEDRNGAPLFLTHGDLAATSGRGTLGATVPEGMAIEVRDDRISPCVLAHEILHFVGLKHVDDKHNIMYPHCSRDFLDTATITEEQVDAVATLDAIRATTPSGVRLWAER